MKNFETLELVNGITFATRLTEISPTETHDHDFYEIFYIKTGSTIHQIVGKTEQLYTGMGFLILPETYHSFKDVSNCIHRDYMISKELFRDVCSFIDEDFFNFLTTQKCLSFKLNPSDMLHLESTIANFYEYNNDEKMKNFQKIIVATLIGFIYIDYSKNNTNSFKAKCIQIISDNFNKENALDIIRGELGYNKFYLCKKFKDTFGVTLVDYINNMKLDRARFMLISSDATIAEILEQINFESPSYFNKLFTKRYGRSPGRYRKEVSLQQPKALPSDG
ncbi:MAG: helix-turn-helix domain-containing protein [Clostridia bacterium]|nr:helix-turn-helix domain-containing protein [Clostridia bacterium]MBQ9481491.1 helix-turn-helix domain-containing protein [Clostridia bacterium]